MFSTSSESTPGLRIANLNSLYSLNSPDGDGEKRENHSPSIRSAPALPSTSVVSPRARRQTLKRAKSYGAKVRDHNKDSMECDFSELHQWKLYNLNFYDGACVTFMLWYDKCLVLTTCPFGCWGG